jgi:hypothetical protein
MSAAVPLISAAIAALVAWIVARQQGKTARENWLLEKRYLVYERIMDGATNLLLGHADQAERSVAIDDPAKRAPLIAAVHRLTLIAPKTVHSLGARVTRASYDGRFTTEQQRGRFIDAVNELNAALREDLVPKHMR